MTADRVLVTGALGLVGSAVVATLAEGGHRVVATDLDIPANRKRAQALTAHRGVQVRWADLTSPADVAALLEEVAPTAIIHLAAVIPPFCYASSRLARAVNVDATAGLVKAASDTADPAALRVGFQHRGLRRAQSLSHRRALDIVDTAATHRTLWRAQGLGRTARDRLGPGLGGAATRRRAHRPAALDGSTAI